MIAGILERPEKKYTSELLIFVPYFCYRIMNNEHSSHFTTSFREQAEIVFQLNSFEFQSISYESSDYILLVDKNFSWMVNQMNSLQSLSGCQAIGTYILKFKSLRKTVLTFISGVIAYTKKYLQSDWLREVQYWPYLYSVFNICTLWLNKKKNQHLISVAEK